MTPFLEVLYKLSHLSGVKLYPDSHNACKLVISDHISIQLEVDDKQERLLLGCIICEVPAGVFREKVLKHAMAANASEIPMYGSLCYVEKKNALALYDFLTIKHLNEDFLLDYLTVLARKAEEWRVSLSENKPGPNLLKNDPEDKPPAFGIKS